MSYVSAGERWRLSGVAHGGHIWVADGNQGIPQGRCSCGALLLLQDECLATCRLIQDDGIEVVPPQHKEDLGRAEVPLYVQEQENIYLAHGCRCIFCKTAIMIFGCRCCKDRGIAAAAELPKAEPPPPTDYTSTHTMSPYMVNGLCQDCGEPRSLAAKAACDRAGTREAYWALEATYSDYYAIRHATTPSKPPTLPEYRGLATGIGGVMCSFGRGRK